MIYRDLPQERKQLAEGQIPELARHKFNRRKASSFVKKMILITVKQIEDGITVEAVYGTKTTGLCDKENNIFHENHLKPQKKFKATLLKFNLLIFG